MANGSSLFCSYRLAIVVVGFFGYCALYIQRVNLGIAILCMVNNTALELLNEPLQNGTYISRTAFNISFQKDSSCNSISPDQQTSIDGEFVWSKKVQGMVLGAFFYGYWPSIMIGGYLTTKFGGLSVTSLSMGLSSLGTLLFPVAARWNVIALLICRVLTGFAQGAFFPSIGVLWVDWIPLNERSRLLGFLTSGTFLGTALSLPVGGYLCSTTGWSSIFYSNGILGVAWVIVFVIMLTNHPKDNRFVSKAERDYIMQQTNSTGHSKSRVQLKTPWMKILSSKILLSIGLVMIAHNWVTYLCLTQIPTYIKEVLKMDIKSNGLYSSLPYLSIVVVTISSGFVADTLSNKGFMRKVNVRRVYTAIGLYGTAICLVGLSFVKCTHQYIGIVLLSVAFAFQGLISSAGALINSYEIGGPFTSVVLSLITTIGNLSGPLTPYSISAMTTNQEQSEWQNVFWLSAGLCVVLSIPYIIFADDSIQDWAKTSDAYIKQAAPSRGEHKSNNRHIKQYENGSDTGKEEVSLLEKR